MRLIKLPILCSAALLLVAASAADNKDYQSSGKDPAAQAPAAKAAEGTVDLTVSGMRWAVNCVNRVRSALLKVSGVIQADVSMPDKAVVKIDKKKKVTTAQLIDAVKKAGYGAKLKEEKKKGSS